MSPYQLATVLGQLAAGMTKQAISADLIRRVFSRGAGTYRQSMTPMVSQLTQARNVGGMANVQRLVQRTPAFGNAPDWSRLQRFVDTANRTNPGVLSHVPQQITPQYLPRMPGYWQADTVQRFGGVAHPSGLPGHWTMPSRTAARQAASELVGDLGPRAVRQPVRMSELRGTSGDLPFWTQTNNTVIGARTPSAPGRPQRGWRDDLFGESRLGQAPHINAESPAIGNQHLFYPSTRGSQPNTWAAHPPAPAPRPQAALAAAS